MCVVIALRREHWQLKLESWTQFPCSQVSSHLIKMFIEWVSTFSKFANKHFQKGTDEMLFVKRGYIICFINSQ